MPAAVFAIEAAAPPHLPRLRLPLTLLRGGAELGGEVDGEGAAPS